MVDEEPMTDRLPPETETEDAQIIDFTSAALEHSRTACMQDGREHEASVISTLLEGYELGMWDVAWRDGEPFFSAPDASEPARAMVDGEVTDEWLYELLRVTGGAMAGDEKGPLSDDDEGPL